MIFLGAPFPLFFFLLFFFGAGTKLCAGFGVRVQGSVKEKLCHITMDHKMKHF